MSCRPDGTTNLRQLGCQQALYMPSATDLYFPVEDARYEAPFVPHCTLMPIPSLWGHPARAGAGPANDQFLNQHIAVLLKG